MNEDDKLRFERNIMEKWEQREFRRQRIIEKAVQTADRIIMEGSDGSCEETNYLTAMVAEAFVQKGIIMPILNAMRTKDIEDDHPGIFAKMKIEA